MLEKNYVFLNFLEHPVDEELFYYTLLIAPVRTDPMHFVPILYFVFIQKLAGRFLT
jgi:hypothetical protein